MNEKEPDFFPLRIRDCGWVLKRGASIEEIGQAFYEMIYELTTKDFNENSLASKMYADALSMIKANEDKARKAAQARWDKERENRQVQTIPPPRSKQEVLEWADDNGIDVDAAGECYEMTYVDRKGRTKDGKVVTNWKAYFASCINTRLKNLKN